MAHPTQAISFSPPPDLIPLIIDQITDPALSLRNIAAANHTTTEALSLWLSSPEIRQRLELLDSAACTRVRQLANAQLDTVLLTLRTIQQNFHAHQLAKLTSSSNSQSSSYSSSSDPHSASDPSESDPRNPRPSAASPLPTSDISHLKSQILNHRIEETARKAGAAIYRLTRLQPAHIQSQPRPTAQQTSTPSTPTHTPSHPNPTHNPEPPSPSGPSPYLAPNPNLPAFPSSALPATSHIPNLPPPPFPITPDHPLATIANLEAFVARLEAEAQAEAQAAAQGETRAEPAAQPQPAAQPNAQSTTHSQPDAAPSIPAAPPPHAPTSLPRNKKKPPHPTQQWRGTSSPSQSPLSNNPGPAPRGPWP